MGHTRIRNPQPNDARTLLGRCIAPKCGHVAGRVMSAAGVEWFACETLWDEIENDEVS
jgi:hypothetical protein